MEYIFLFLKNSQLKKQILINVKKVIKALVIMNSNLNLIKIMFF